LSYADSLALLYLAAAIGGIGVGVIYGVRLDRKGSAQFADQLKQMNMTSALLFPGFDGFAFSLRELILHYENLARRGTGGAGSTVPMWR
jgi:hypothetical protein